jgi:Rap1a immunity proteins
MPELYIGVADQFAFQNYVALTLKKSGLPGNDCIYARIPDDADAKTLRDIVLKYLEKTPPMLENPAVVTVGAAMSEAYPCLKLPAP